MTHDFKPGQLVKYVGTCEIDGRQTGDILQLDRHYATLHRDPYWWATILRTGHPTRVFLSYIQPIGDQDDGNP